MKFAHYMTMAMTGIVRRKKAVITNILLMSLALITLMITMTLINTINEYIDEFILNSKNFRTITLNVFKYDSERIEKQIEKIAKEDEHIIEFYHELFGVVCKMQGADKLMNTDPTELGQAYGHVSLKAGTQQDANFMITGDYIKGTDTHVGIIPKMFYPDTSFDIGFFDEQVDFIDGETLIGETITVNYYAYDYSGNSMKKIKTFSYSFKVVGVYDIIPNHYYPYDIIIPYNDLKKIAEDIDTNSIGLAEDYAKVYSVIVDDYNYVDKAISKLESAGLAGRPKATLGSIVDISQYIFWGGETLGLFIMLISLINIMLTMVKAIKKRTGEIGLLKAIGYRNIHILFIIGLEAAIIGTLSFIVAVVVSAIFLSILSIIIAQNSSMYIQALQIQISYPHIAKLAVVSIALPLLGSLYGIMYSLRVRPKEAISKGSEIS